MSHFALRDLAPTDADWIAAACQDHEIQRWLPRVPQPYRREDAEAFIGGASGEFRNWVIERDGEPTGVIGVHTFDTITGVATVGYWIAPWGRRQGAARAALLLVAEHFAGIDGAQRLRALIAVSNRASRRTAEAAGFHLAEESPTLTCPDGSHQVPTLVFELPLAEFLDRHAP